MIVINNETERIITDLSRGTKIVEAIGVLGIKGVMGSYEGLNQIVLNEDDTITIQGDMVTVYQKETDNYEQFGVHRVVCIDTAEGHTRYNVQIGW